MIFRLTATIIHAINKGIFTLCVNCRLILRIKTAIVYQNVSYVNCTLYTVVTVTSKENMRLACVNDVLAGNCYYYSKHMYELYISL